MDKHQDNMSRAEALFLEELISFVRTVNARSKMLLEAYENLQHRRAIIEAARKMEEEGHGEKSNQTA